MAQEEKYKEALLEARAVLEPCLKYSNGKVREALDSIDKELKSFESEDERIRKELIEYHKQQFENNRDQEVGLFHKAAIAYLEKQNEQKPAECEDCAMYLSGNCIHPNGKCENVKSRQEWSEEETKDLVHILKVLDDCYIYGKHDLSKTDHDNLTSTLKSLRPQKLDASKLENFDPVDVLNRIKTEWPMAWEKVVGKQEWSEEDKKMIDCIINVLASFPITFTSNYNGGTSISYGGFKYQKEMDWLKSLRPSWKPSEHQMNILKAVKDYVGAGSGYWGEGLGSLIDDLEKLM